MRRWIVGNRDVESDAIRGRWRFAGPRVCLDATLGILFLFLAFNIIPVAPDGGSLFGVLSADEAEHSAKYPEALVINLDEGHGPAWVERLLAARPSRPSLPGEARPLAVRTLPSRRTSGDSPPDPL